MRIWDLVNKVIYKQINYDSSWCCCSYEIIPWNSKYLIFGSDGYFIIMDINEGNTIQKIDNTVSHEIRSMKKIKIEQLGECLICGGDGNYGIIKLYSV